MADRRGGTNDSQTEYKWTGVECTPCREGGLTDGTGSAELRHRFTETGSVFYRHNRKILIVGILVLCLGCLGLQTATTETDIESLLVQDEGQVSEQLQHLVSSRGKGSQTVRQVVLQMSRVPGKSVLSADSLIQHFNLLHSATRVSVDLFGITWQLKDICRSVSFPNFDDDSAIDQILKSLEACVIITPLDCFWEGSKLLGPDYGVYFPSYSNGVKWSNLNPEKIVQSFNQIGIHFPHEEEIDKLLKRAGITSAYQELPCLDPFDPECPVTAPNYLNKQLPDVEKALANGCTGFATRFMVWDEDLIIGRRSRSASGTMLSESFGVLPSIIQESNPGNDVFVFRAEAVKSVVQLMGEKELYDFHRDTYKVHGLNWNQSLSKQVLEAWQRLFTQKIQEMSSVLTTNDSLADDVYSLSLLNLEDCLKDASRVDFRRVAFVCIALLIYICLVLVELPKAVPSKVALGCAGLLLIVLSTVSGFGICSLLGLKFNVATEQVLPFLVIGLGASDVLLIVQNYAQLTKFDIPQTELLSWCHRECCQVILTASVTICFSFFFWTISPIPALQSFCFQGAVLIIVNMVSLLLIYPGFLNLDLLRQKKKTSLDPLCCSSWNHKQCPFQPTETECAHGNQLWSTCFSKAESLVCNGKVSAVTQRSTTENKFHDDFESHMHKGVDTSVCQHAGAVSSQQCLIGEKTNKFKEYFSNLWTKFHYFRFSLFVRNVYGPLLQEAVTKVVIICIFFTSLGVGVFGMMHLNDRMSLAELVPRSSGVHGFLEVEFSHFGFSSFTAVTKEKFDYSSARGQLLLHSYHQAFHRVDAIVKMSDDQCPGFWLQFFRSWLINVQDAFDIGLKSGCITEDGWLGNSSSDARLGHKLIIQTGDTSNPFDRKRVFTGRLVDENGIIYPPGFYIYLSAWASNSAIEFAFSEGNLQPPPRQWFHDKDDQNLQIPKSKLLKFTQLPFHLHNVKDTETAMATIQEIRNISDYFVMRGLPNIPTGLIFTFFEQYNSLHLFLGIALIASLLVFFVLCLALMDAWTATIAVVAVAVLTIQVLGFLGLFGIGMNAITATVVTTGIGIGAKVTVHLSVKFLVLLGSQNRRMVVALENSISSIFHGSIIAIIGSIGFATLEFDFITKYIFLVIVAFILFGVFDGLVVLPVLLSLIGPPTKIDTLSDHDNQIPSLSLKLHLNKTQRKKSSDQNTNKTSPHSVFGTSTDSNTKFVFVNTMAKSTEISSDMTFEMSVFCNHGTPKTSNCENIEDQPLTANNTELSDANYSENQIRKTIATAKVEVEVHTHTKGEDEFPEFKTKRRKLMTTSNPDFSVISSKTF